MFLTSVHRFSTQNLKANLASRRSDKDDLTYNEAGDWHVLRCHLQPPSRSGAQIDAHSRPLQKLIFPVQLQEFERRSSPKACKKGNMKIQTQNNFPVKASSFVQTTRTLVLFCRQCQPTKEEQQKNTRKQEIKDQRACGQKQAARKKYFAKVLFCEFTPKATCASCLRRRGGGRKTSWLSCSLVFPVRGKATWFQNR